MEIHIANIVAIMALISAILTTKVDKYKNMIVFCAKKKMASLTLKQKKEWAQLLITKEGYTQKDAAAKVEVSVVTMNKWYNDLNWQRLKQSMLITRQEQLGHLYMQLDELNTAIKNREAGKRYADSKEADTISKLAGAINKMESEASIADVVEVSKRLLNWLRPLNHVKALEISAVFNDFIKEILKK